MNARTLHNVFQVDSQGTSRLGIVPWTRVEIVIGMTAGNAPDRTQGVVIPEIEGEGLYVEKADWPVLLCPVIGQAPTQESLLSARDGLFFDSPFKGLYLAHPPLVTTFATQPLKLSLIVFKVKGAVNNELAWPICRALMQSRVVTNTPTAQQTNIFIPPGSRQLDYFRVTTTATTLTAGSPTVTMVDQGGNPIVAPTVQQQIGSAVVTYNFAPTGLRVALVGGVATAPVFDFSPIAIPSAARELALAWAGTGLVPPVSIEGRWS